MVLGLKLSEPFFGAQDFPMKWGIQHGVLNDTEIGSYSVLCVLQNSVLTRFHPGSCSIRGSARNKEPLWALRRNTVGLECGTNQLCN